MPRTTGVQRMNDGRRTNGNAPPCRENGRRHDPTAEMVSAATMMATAMMTAAAATTVTASMTAATSRDGKVRH